jgi:hypothetical protein
MENLNYSIYNNNNNVENSNSVALTNRPLPVLSKDHNCKSGNCNPNASEDIYKAKNNSVDTKYNDSTEKIHPVVIKPDNNNNYIVLENDFANLDDVMNYNNNDKIITNMPIPKIKDDDKRKDVYKMDLSTTIYIGSLTVIGLFVFFRILQKTK